MENFEFHQIISRIEQLIEEKGIPFFLDKWKKPIVPKKFRDYNTFVTFANKFISSYHKHSFIQSKSQTQGLQKVQKRNDRKMPRVAFQRGIGRITFFHFYRDGKNSVEEKKLISIVRRKISIWKKSGLDGLIIDLRKHYGGDMYPALNSLVEIFGDTTLFSFDNVKTEPTDKKWVNFHKGEIVWDKKFFSNKLATKIPIAVLVSKDTLSSGEFIAAAFFGKKNVKIFGENTGKTGGYLSSNKSYEITSDLDLALTESLTTTTDGTFHVKEHLPVKKVTHSIPAAEKWIDKMVNRRKKS